ncbi:MAG: exodeoxyribonuclease VII large subunit [Deltaproteobacteria bacterium]|nr:exodeoxyribonuclease VII large subunit [Deltaproteobacteria bacterium]MBW2170678.1 exodeoxyribonuclease VII large subunit [Deltaproteobacteria bacterium]
MQIDPPASERHIFTVTELTHKIKSLLESAYPFVWLIGEISNFRVPASGHFYFTLKDSDSQISAVMFRAQNKTLRFTPEDGLLVIAMGRLNVYEVRGVYQIILEYLEPEGVGVLQLAFEKLKAKLAEEGLFDEGFKKPLPFLPGKIAVVTSPTGAAIRDILNVINRRYPNVDLEIAPARVQGEQAPEEIAEAVNLINECGLAEVIVVARGGGSLEDLQAFNSEVVARAIFSSSIPVVSAVGHETDFTIADFVADVRAPTPSAAAELIVPVKEDLVRTLEQVSGALKTSLLQRLRFLRERTAQVSRRLVHPKRQIADYRLRLDDATERMVKGLSRHLGTMTDRQDLLKDRLFRASPQSLVEELHVKLKHNLLNLSSTMQLYMQSKRSSLQTAMARLDALSPLAILDRGYSVTRALPGYALVKDVQQVSVGQQVQVTLSRGGMLCRVERKEKHGQTDI